MEELNFADVLGILGFLLAALLAWFEYQRYRKPLLITLKDIRRIGRAQGRCLVLLRICFVNPSLTGRTVFDIGAGAPTEESVGQVQVEFEIEKRMITVQLRSNPQVESSIPENEYLRLPLDIPPHQSRTLWRAVDIKCDYPESPNGDYVPFHLRLQAFDAEGKRLCSTDQVI